MLKISFFLVLLIGANTRSEYTYEAPQSIDGQDWTIVDTSAYDHYTQQQQEAAAVASNEIVDNHDNYNYNSNNNNQKYEAPSPSYNYNPIVNTDILEERQAGVGAGVAGPLLALGVGGANFAWTQSQLGLNSDKLSTLATSLTSLENAANQLQIDITSLSAIQREIQSTLTATKLVSDVTCTILKPVTTFSATLEGVEAKDTMTDTAATQVDNLLGLIKDMADLATSTC